MYTESETQKIHLFGESELYNNPTVPEHTQGAIEDYVLRGWEPGSFLSAVITNDLYRAAQSADHINKASLADISLWLYHNSPASSIGSAEAMQNWCNDKGDRRTTFVDKLIQAKVWQNISE